MNKAYNKVLDYFKYKFPTDNQRFRFENAFIFGEFVVATDKSMLCFFDKNHINLDYIEQAPVELNKSLTEIIPTQRLKSPVIFTLEHLKAIFDKLPKKPLTVKGELKKCSACNGNRSVEYTYSYKGEDYHADLGCPVCEGEGNVDSEKETGEMIIDEEEAFIIFGSSVFSYKMFKCLEFVAENLNESEIKCIWMDNESNRPSLYRIADVTILLMPCMKTDEIMKIAIKL